jgi:hypothetical protein
MTRKALVVLMSLVCAFWLTFVGCGTPDEVILEDVPRAVVNDVEENDVRENDVEENATRQQ